MKKIYSLLLTVFAVSVCFAQSQRLVLMEEFTQASCPPCAAYNPAFNVILNANSAKIVSIKYQVNWPGYDPMNVHNASEVATRVSYYAVTGVPDGVMDGGSGTSTWHANPASFSATYVNNRYSIASPFNVNLTHYFSPNYDSIFVHADVIASQAFSQTSVLRIAVIERDIIFCSPPGTNGETHFEGVMKKMLPNATGTTLPATWTNGQTASFDFAWKLANVYDKNTLAVVGFVQNTLTKEVHQTAYSDEQQMMFDARLVCSSIGIPTAVCGTIVSPAVTFQNLGSATLTSLNINYQLDGGTITPATWNGSLTSGNTATYNIPNLNVSLGAHNLNVTISNPNGSNDLNVYYDNAAKAFSAVSNTGATLPLIQDFVSVIFPPANWTRVNPDNAATWTRVTAGFNTTGSTKMDFYNSPAAQTDELWTPGYDFSGFIATAQLDFDIAYWQYGAGYDDKIEAQVSTDCGLTWSTIYNKQGAVRSTVAGYQTTVYTPTATSQWRHETVSMNSFIGQQNVFVRFRATSDYGNNCYIDNINITFAVGVNETTLSQHVTLYPNPTEGKIYLDINFDKAKDLKVEIFNLVGEKVNGFEFNNTIGGIYPVDLSKMANGSYVVKISTGDEMMVKPLQIAR